LTETTRAIAPVRVIQISDTHLFASADGEFDGVNTLASLRATLAKIKTSSDGHDFVVVSGDLVHEETDASYELLRSVLYSIDGTVCCIPGNHDDPALMQKHLRDRNLYLPRLLLRAAWQFVFINTHVDGTHGGHVPTEELQFLEQRLADAPGRFTGVFLHHPPVSIDSPWMDTMGLDNGEDLLVLADRYAALRCIAWGHIHQEFVAQRAQAQLLGAPSTCVQFKPRSDGYQKDSLGAGFRWFEFQGDGSVVTGVERIS